MSSHYLNSCVKVPIDPCNNCPAPVYNRPEAFQTWCSAGLKIAVYSSGSVAAQKLIFGHSIAGNLQPHLSAHFDTHVGHKQEQQSYDNIAKLLKEEPQEILFLTDIPGGERFVHINVFQLLNVTIF